MARRRQMEQGARSSRASSYEVHQADIPCCMYASIKMHIMHFAYMCVIIIIIILFVMHSVYMYNWKQIWALSLENGLHACYR